MRVRIVPVLLVLALVALFAVINWTAFTTPTELNLGFMMVTAPLGAVMLGVALLLGVMYIASVVYLQGVALLESRRLQKELQAQRTLADEAEASRVAALRDFMGVELQRVLTGQAELRANLSARLDQMEQRTRVAMEESANSLSAYIGELEDRLDNRSSIPGDLPRQRTDFRAPG